MVYRVVVRNKSHSNVDGIYYSNLSLEHALGIRCTHDHGNLLYALLQLGRKKNKLVRGHRKPRVSMLLFSINKYIETYTLCLTGTHQYHQVYLDVRSCFMFKKQFKVAHRRDFYCFTSPKIRKCNLLQ